MMIRKPCDRCKEEFIQTGIQHANQADKYCTECDKLLETREIRPELVLAESIPACQHNFQPDAEQITFHTCQTCGVTEVL